MGISVTNNVGVNLRVVDRVSPTDGPRQVAVVVPHTHWDREWYVPFETMRFHLVQFFDDLLDVMEAEPDLVFLLDGQTVIVEDYLEIRRDQTDRIERLVRSGRLRPGPFYTQPDEFHVSGESIVRNLLIGCRTAAELGGCMREGYLPDTFGHVAQLPQILRGFGIETFYAMRGFGNDPTVVDNEFWWQAPDGSRVLVNWLSESYSNAGVLTHDPEQMVLHHGALVHYDRLSELLERLSERSPSGVLLLLNGGDHLRVQTQVPEMVASLDAATATTTLRTGGLEEFHALVTSRPLPEVVVTGELRHGLRHDVFDGIGSTRTPMKVQHARVESLVCDAAERLDALATLADGRSNLDSMRHLWRELVKNHAHDSICGCSVDEVHAEMGTRFDKISQLARAVVTDSVRRLGSAFAPPAGDDEVPVVVVNPSAFPRTEGVTVAVVSDLDAPLGRRTFGWHQRTGVDLATYRLLDEEDDEVAFEVRKADQVTVVDTLSRRKEVLADQVHFVADEVPALAVRRYRLVPGDGGGGARSRSAASYRSTEHVLANDHLRATVETDGTLTLTHLASRRTVRGLCEVVDDGDAGDEYGFGPVPGQEISSREVPWTVAGISPHRLVATATLRVPTGIAPEGGSRSDDLVDLPLRLELSLPGGSDRLDLDVTVDNTARDHRLRLRCATWPSTGESVAESAFGLEHRGTTTAAEGWHDPPSGVYALRRFVVVEGDEGALQVLTEGLCEYRLDEQGDLDLTLLRSVGWLARSGHPRRAHKIGPELATPAAQCLGRHTFRLGLRLPGPDEGPGDWYRHAERFSSPLHACSVPPRARPATTARSRPLGLSLAPDQVVLSALKTAEDAAGVIVRIFNAEDTPCAARVHTAVPLAAAWRCDLEERPLRRLEPEEDRSLALDLRGGEIATLWLRPRD